MVDLLIERGTTSVVPNFGNKALLPQFFFDEIRAPMVVFVILVEWLCTIFFALWHIELLTERSCDGVWACSLGGILEEFGWFGGMLEKFVREKHCFE